MYVITADQVASRHHPDRASELIDALVARHRSALVLPADQTAGDEVQLITESAPAALEIVLDATRDEHWSVGLGVGHVRTPLPDAARKASGTAFIAAREAVQAAKRADGRFALRAASAVPAEPGRRIDELDAAQVEALIRLVVLIRERRSDLGWEVADLARAGHLQKDIATMLGISAAAVSARLKAAMWRAEADALPALVRLLAGLDAGAGRAGTS
ncbi:DNA-binding protein [Agromyces salentinus]|uniref:DNA-binding protein n=1 Tax=Agromyces salentinus TaxID=269421 RepID=A0ABN2N1U6_9MICO|nr:DNA-binding protein [Agromyces salentinus]